MDDVTLTPWTMKQQSCCRGQTMFLKENGNFLWKDEGLIYVLYDVFITEQFLEIHL